MTLNDELFGVRVVGWATAIAIVLLVGLAHIGLRWWIRWRVRAAEKMRGTVDGETPRARYWLIRGLKEAGPALALLLWIYGLYFAIAEVMEGWSLAREGLPILKAARGIAAVIALAWLMMRIGRTLEAMLYAKASRTKRKWDNVFALFAARTLRMTAPLVAIILGVPALSVTPRMERVVENAVSLLLIGVITMVTLQLLSVMTRLILRRYDMQVSDNRRARAMHTQVSVLRRIIASIVVLFAVASMLMVFDPVRHFGTAILASAGVAGVIIGFAAQKTIAMLLAGLQIALTQPIRIDDVVIVENEWGKIEEITLTYVVVAIWDLRRLVLPITYFVEKPFQNWTRVSADLLGSVFLQVDYQVPIDALRAELKRILEISPLWDRKVCVLQVTDLKEHTVELRALASARDAGQSWDLRCDVREKLIAFIQKNYPESLPRLRAHIEERRFVEQHVDKRASA